MAPRPRSKKNKGLEPNLYSDKSARGVTYFRYKNPITGERFPMGSDRVAANAAARVLNARLMKGQDLVGRVLNDGATTMADLIDRYIKEQIPAKKLSSSTAKITGYRLGRVKKDLGAQVMEYFTVQNVAKYLDQHFERDAYVKHRALLVELFRFAIVKGLYPVEKGNPAEVTYSKTDYGKERQRLTVAGYLAIYEHPDCPDWLRTAMDLALVTLQGRWEICHVRFADIAGDKLRVIREKTKGNEWAKLEIAVTPQIDEIVGRARRSGIASPYIVHRMPERKVRSKDTTHWTQVRPDYLGKTFQAIRDKIGAFQVMQSRERPTFHEIRALGSWLYEKQGFDRSGYVQQLMAHSDAKMTEHYQSGHEEKWMQVRADLDLKAALKGK
jgi:enterobacteria phage integrase